MQITYLSPRYTTNDFGPALTLDDKIKIFGDRVIGWQLAHADRLPQIDTNSGYAVLHIVTSYFEMISKYLEGAGSGASESHFKKGFALVVPEIATIPAAEREAALKILYKGLRCGLYHGGMTSGPIAITWQSSEPLHWNGAAVLLNPAALTKRIASHFAEYMRMLRDATNADLRMKFERRFNANH